MNKKLYRIKQAWNLFKSVRDNDKKGYSINRDLRFCYFYYLQLNDDNGFRQWFSNPKNRKSFIRHCDEALKGVNDSELNGLIESRQQYDKCRLLLKQLRIFATRFPLLYHLRFDLRF